MGVACSAYGGEERCIQGFGGETSGKEATWRTQDNTKIGLQEVGCEGTD